ncbi:predicted protein [Sclerotinia sclerotiorum 1980 UF-70]|uniref:Uncharacterized protein n=1 Tax=Sclerotinia sclerotiorum (strain ATCC 18683 / 1980 / Ss-1) TaxID=665079 RepID=A7EB32_SCLS1|nr:predicted protein [Sclerotinia sclerotiorum 1980 UF-70]EDN99660.1 predicted protein [Sclerotinia sclerotiorum 1980 UF-70]
MFLQRSDLSPATSLSNKPTAHCGVGITVKLWLLQNTYRVQTFLLETSEDFYD